MEHHIQSHTEHGIPTPRPMPGALQNQSLHFNAMKTGVRTTAKQGTKTKKKNKRQKQGNHMVMYRHLGKLQHIIRLLRNVGTISSNGGGTILQANIATGSVNTTAPDWTNIAQEFSNYRVRRLILHLYPATTGSTAITGPYQSVMALTRWWGQVPSGSATFRQASTEFVSTLEEYTFENNWNGFLDAQEYVSTGSTIPADDSFGVSWMTVTAVATLAASSVIFSYVVEYEVEFMGVH